MMRDLYCHAVESLERIFDCQQGLGYRFIYRVYADKGFNPSRCITRARAGLLNANERRQNQVMSGLRIAVEWSYGEALNQFQFVGYFRNNHLLTHKNVKFYPLIALLLRNAQVCLRGANATQYFDLEPPSLEQYFHERY